MLLNIDEENKFYFINEILATFYKRGGKAKNNYHKTTNFGAIAILKLNDL